MEKSLEKLTIVKAFFARIHYIDYVSKISLGGNDE